MTTSPRIRPRYVRRRHQGRRRRATAACPGDPQRRRRGGAGRSARRSISSGSASTTGPTLRSPPPRPCWRRSPRAPRTSASARPVTVLSSDDPIRVFQRFATVDAVSNGRAEVILGRGSFTRSFPLFGFDLQAIQRAVRGEARSVHRTAEAGAGDLAGQAAAAARQPVGLSAGRARPAEDLDRRRRQPRIGGARGALRPAADARHHRRRSQALCALCRPAPARLRSSSAGRRNRSACIRRATSPRPTRQAREELWPDYKVMRDRIGEERGWPPMGA